MRGLTCLRDKAPRGRDKSTLLQRPPKYCAFKPKCLSHRYVFSPLLLMSGPAPDEDLVDPSSPLPGNGPRGTCQLGKQTQERSAGGSSKSLTQAIVLDAGPDIPIINADEFIADFLPKVSGAEAALGRIVSWIETCPLYYADRRWAGFPTDPAKAGETEDLVFERLSVVFDAILAAVSEVTPELVGRRTTEYVAKPTKPPETVFRQDKSRPDAYFLFLNRFSRDKENPHWMDIAVAGEFKKENKPETVESVRGHRLSRGPSLLTGSQRISHKCCGTCTRKCGKTLGDESASDSRSRTATFGCTPLPAPRLSCRVLWTFFL